MRLLFYALLAAATHRRDVESLARPLEVDAETDPPHVFESHVPFVPHGELRDDDPSRLPVW